MPFVEALESYAQEEDAHALRADLGSGAADIARIVPTVRARLSLSPPLSSRTHEDRERLIAGFVRAVAQRGEESTVAAVLEDLHDRP
jgi:hypothetical protein